MQEHGTRQPPEQTPSDTATVVWRRPTTARVKSEHHRAFGHVVRVTRVRHGLSQEALGDRADLHRNYIGAIERGEINPTFRVLLKLEAGLGIALSKLICLTEREIARANR